MTSKKEKAAPRTGPGSTYDAVPEVTRVHLKRNGNKVNVDMNTFLLIVSFCFNCCFILK